VSGVLFSVGVCVCVCVCVCDLLIFLPVSRSVSIAFWSTSSVLYT